MKRTLFILTICIALLLAPIGAYAEDEQTKCFFNDYVGILSEDDHNTVEARLAEVSKKTNADIIVLILPETYGMSARTCAASFFEDYGYGADTKNGGVIFLFVTGGTEQAGSRDSAIEVFGRCMEKIDADVIYDSIEGSFYINDYLNGFLGYANSCAKQMAFPFMKYFGITLAIGMIIALIIVMIMKSKLTSVHSQRDAVQYTRPGSLKVTRSKEIYLYSHTSSVRRERDSDSGGSSGGSSHTGSSRKL